ncbi:GNAT family N-acetyltransferase [Paraburkholderia acidicola]|uniref:GNAT family N-acetyltransferase n=1 Tax=Paraburkholderia acidicola TaxID=1912599 RepID=A0A2A4F313_9BURK|nr:N-acetyltransferase [Paraburkholderia acidicola]PCE27102.1 GNAT family N-acetyltransferase [Paraburkholderia acidicola]
MTITVRRAIPEDWPALRQLFLQGRRETFEWQAPEKFALEDFDAQTQGELLLIAEDELAHPVGFISVWEEDSFIHHLYVARSHHRRGVGTALLRALPRRPTLRYRLKCLVLNTSALAFYRACRFVEIGSGTSGDGDYVLLKSHNERTG